MLNAIEPESVLFESKYGNVSTKVVKIVQSYTNIVNKMVWRETDRNEKKNISLSRPYVGQ